MIKCTMEQGKMVFTGVGMQRYVIDELNHTEKKTIIKEFKLLDKIMKDHGWSLPVIEALQTRKNLLLKLNMDMDTGVQNGRIIQQSQRDENAESGHKP